MRLRGRLLQSGAQIFTTVITLGEELRGVLAHTNRTLDPDERILAYQKLIERVNFFARWVVLSLDAESTAAFNRFRSQGIRIGTMDLRIACIALVSRKMVFSGCSAAAKSWGSTRALACRFRRPRRKQRRMA